ncbi:MAG: hypothetical protein ABII06_20010 [Pseudomonadota bacterium]
MMIENLSSMPSFQSQDYRTEKKTELEVRAIEESGESHDTALDIDRRGAAGNPSARAQGDEPEALTYNEKGLVNQNPALDPESPEGQSSIDLFV